MTALLGKRTFTCKVFLMLLLLLCVTNHLLISTTEAKRVSHQEKLLSITDAVLLALENNLDISVSRRTRDTRLTDILFEQAKFHPTLNFSGRFDRSTIPLNRPIFGFGGITTGNEPDNISQVEAKSDIGISQKFLSGGSFDLTFDSSRTSVQGQTSFLFNPAYTTGLRLNLTHPLLRDFGLDVNRTEIRLAQNAAKVEHYAFLDKVLSVIVEVEETYWELVSARENLKVAKAALKAAKALLKTNRALVKAKIMAQIEILQAKAGVASRLEQVLIAENTLRDQNGKIRLLFTSSEDQLRQNFLIVPTSKPVKEFLSTSLDHAIDTALANRPEILQAQKTIEKSALNVKFAKNQLLPNLTFQGSVGLQGLGNSVSDAADRMSQTNFFNMGAGLVLSYPLGNHSASSQYNRRQLEALRAQSSLQKVRHEAIVNTKQAIRNIHTNLKRIQTTVEARKLTEQQLRAEQERLNLGLSTTRIVLDFQRDLANAQGNEIRAITDYNKAIANLRRITATTFNHYDIVFES